ncbi:IS66 family insertion sequence element accessory protein TnpB, partial [Sinorhizobium saheli]|uniref:IS66 family insertion sequence element accessory protein TnpB n=1 Tax=Sinorhizobium saheli TaxID=36856 RepID=UPI000AD21A8D
MNPFPMGTGVKVWLSTGYTDMRCGFPSLALRVQEVLQHDPLICVGLDYVAASLAVLRFPAGCPLGRHIIVPS